MERSSFSSGRGPFRQNDSIKTSEVSSEIFPFEQILEDFNETFPAHQNVTHYNFGQGIIIQCCVPVPEGKEILIHEDEVCCKNTSAG